MKRRTSATIALVVGPVIGAAVPLIQVHAECYSAPQSEACVWGKALLPVSVILSTVILGAIAAMGVFLLLDWHRRRNEDAD